MSQLLSLRGICKSFVARRDLLGRAQEVVNAVRGIDLDIEEGETLALVGETGCGKSTTGRLTMGLIEPDLGTIHFAGEDVTAPPRGRPTSLRRRMQIVFQDPESSFNPSMTVRRCIAEPMRVHLGGEAARDRDRIAALLENVGLDPDHMERRPHELSGGQRQRVAIARAIAVDPDFVVCDEVVSALDVSTQAQVLNLLMDLQERRHLAYLFITHDLSIVPSFARRVAVMYLGRIVEMGPVTEVFTAPRHPYTQALISAIPVPDPKRQRRRNHIVLAGDPPNPAAPPTGCSFHPRCAYALPRACTGRDPELLDFDTVKVACHLHDEGPVLAGRPIREASPTETGAG